MRRSTGSTYSGNAIPGVLAGLLAGLLASQIPGPVSASPPPDAPAECPGNPDALGTSRVLVVDPAEHPKLGGMQYHETLPLEDHEIVLTFDDGPLPPRTTSVLDTLDHECVKATFFLIGKMAHAYPDWVKRIREAGHTIGTHSNSHPLTFHRMPLDRAQYEINQGIANVTAALGDGSGPAPFFRIPGLLRADGVERYAASKGIQVWSADFVADDWTRITPEQVYSRAMQRIEAGHKGILLLHDIQPRTATALPWLLRELKRRGYRIVQVVPATPDRPKTATDPSMWLLHAHQVSRTPIFIENEPELPAPSPASFGFDIGANSLSYFQKLSLSRDPAWLPVTLPAAVPVAPVPVSPWPTGFDVARAPTHNLSDEFHMPAGSFDTVGDPRSVVAVNEIQRLLEMLPEDSPPADDGPHGPNANTVMHGAFP